MLAKNKDTLFLVAGVMLGGGMAVALSYPDPAVGLYGAAGLLGIVMVLAIIIKPNIGANILIFAIFSNISAQLSDNGYPSVIKPLVAVVFGAIMVRNYYADQLPKDRKRLAVFEASLIVYFAAVAASYLVAANKARAMSDITELAKNIVILYTLLFSLREWATWKQAVWVVVLTTFVLSMLGVYQVVSGNHEQEFFRFSTVEVEGVLANDNSSTPRIGGPVHDPNYWAMIIVSVIPLVLSRIVHERDMKWKLLGAGILGVFFVILLNTYSRGGYLEFMVVIVLAVFVFEKHFHPIVAVAGLGLFILLLPLLPSTYRARFESLPFLSGTSSKETIYEDSSLQGRSSVMQTGLTMFSYNPLLGVGVGNFRNNYQKYNQIVGIEYEYGEREAHSLYTQILSETGIIGTLAFIGVVASLLSGLGRTVRNIKSIPAYAAYAPWITSFQTAIVGYLVGSAFLHGSYIRYFWILVALAATGIQLVDEQLSALDQSKQQEQRL